MDETPGRRAAAYWFVDGLPDILLGLAFLLPGAAVLAWRRSLPHPWIYDLWLMGGFYLLFLWRERPILQYLKSHLTYPRTGYAMPPEEYVPGANLTELSLDTRGRSDNVTYFYRRSLQVIWGVIYVSFAQSPPRLLAPCLMVTLAALLYWLNRKLEHPYRWWSIALLAASGAVFLAFHVPPIWQAPMVAMLAGGWMTLQGVFTVFSYLRANPRPGAVEGLRV